MKNATIKQDELQQVLNLRLVAETAKKQAEQATDELKKAEQALVGRIEDKAKVEAGPLGVGVETVPGRRVPKWKEEFAKRLGADKVEEVINGTEPTPPTLRLVIVQAGKITKTA